jgi:hypothetical protein
VLKTQRKINFVDSSIIDTIDGINHNLDTEYSV